LPKVAAAGLLALTLVAPAASAPSIHLVRHQQVTLEVRPLTASTVPDRDEPWRLTVDESAPAQLELSVLWPDAERPSPLRLVATMHPSPAGMVVRIESELTPAGQAQTIGARREMVFTEATETALFEVARQAGRVLTLALSGEQSERTEYHARPAVGRAVQFELDIEWLENGSSVVLETNRLNTFVGQSVSYSFQLGQPGEGRSGNIELLPVKLSGDTVRIEVSISGTLPDGDGGMMLVSRKEQWLATGGTTSTMSLATGEPPEGFRFAVIPRF
jgi:hypothetical protein